MATIQRPVKTYGTRNYVGEVAAAPGNEDPILASEVDADLDTIYAAWNGGADTVNIKDGSVTAAKLDPNAQYWKAVGVTLTPTDPTKVVAIPGDATVATALLGNSLVKARLEAVNGANPGAGFFVNRNFPTNVQDDATKPSWGVFLSAQNDQYLIQRSAAGSTTQANLVMLDGTGAMTLNGNAASVLNQYGAGAGNASHVLRSGRGTLAAPTAIQSGDILAQIAFGGYGASAYGDGALIRAQAQENWTNTARGASCAILVNAQGSAGFSHSLTFDSVGGLYITGSVGQKASGTTWANPSDRRLKDEIADYATGLAAILQLQPRTFVYNGKGGSPAGLRGYGFIADEMAPVMPETVGVRAGKLDPDDEVETEIQTLDQSNLILALVNAVKEVAARVTALEAR